MRHIRRNLVELWQLARDVWAELRNPGLMDARYERELAEIPDFRIVQAKSFDGKTLSSAIVLPPGYTLTPYDPPKPENSIEALARLVS